VFEETPSIVLHHHLQRPSYRLHERRAVRAVLLRNALGSANASTMALRSGE
jgi:hypothetical protein